MKIKEYSISNEYLSITILNYGATLKSFKYLNKEMILFYDDNTEYKNDLNQLGATAIGPIAGRIKHGTFRLNDQDIQLDCNFNNHNLHSGKHGYSEVYFNVDVKDNKIILRHHDYTNISKFPGNISVEIIYELKENKLVQQIRAYADNDTFFAPTNHVYFNFNYPNNVLNYQCYLDIDHVYLTDDEGFVSEAIDVKNSTHHNKLVNGHKLSNICHEYNLEQPMRLKKPSILIKDNHSKINLLIETNQRHAIIYPATYLGILESRSSKYQKYDGLCIEPQALPGIINDETQKDEILLKKDDNYLWETSYTFTKENA